MATPLVAFPARTGPVTVQVELHGSFITLPVTASLGITQRLGSSADSLIDIVPVSWEMDGEELFWDAGETGSRNVTVEVGHKCCNLMLQCQ